MNQGDKLSILVLDDSDLIADLVTFAFRNYNVNVTGVTHGKEALRLLERTPFNLIITDLKMPTMTGFEFLKQVRASSSFGHVPAIILSGYENEISQAQLKESGADAYLKKPFTPEQLQACARKLLG